MSKGRAITTRVRRISPARAAQFRRVRELRGAASVTAADLKGIAERLRALIHQSNAVRGRLIRYDRAFEGQAEPLPLMSAVEYNRRYPTRRDDVQPGAFDDSFDFVAGQVRRWMPFIDAGPDLLPGKAIDIPFSSSQLSAIFGVLSRGRDDAWPAINLQHGLNIARLIRHVIARPKVYYVGFGSSGLFDRFGTFDLLGTLLETDFHELIGVEYDSIQFQSFKDLTRLHLAGLVPLSSIEFSVDQKDPKAYIASFFYRGRKRTVKVYYNYDGLKGIPKEIQAGFNVLISGVSIYGAYPIVDQWLSLLNESAGIVLEIGGDLTTYNHPWRENDNGTLLLEYRDKWPSLARFVEVSSRPFFALAKEYRWNHIQHGGHPQWRTTLLVTYHTASRLGTDSEIEKQLEMQDLFGAYKLAFRAF